MAVPARPARSVPGRELSSRRSGQAIAEAYGFKAWTAKTGGELDAALAEAFAWKDGPCFIDIHVESIADRVPPVYSWLTKRGANPLDLRPEAKSYI